MIFLQKAWAFTKKYWQLALLILGAVAGVLLFRKQDTNFADDLKKIQDAHQTELRQIEAARAEEQHQHLVNEKRLQDSLEAVQAQYDSAKKDLDDKKKREIEDIVKQYGDNPTELARQLSAVTGFSIILPTQ